MLLWSVTQTMQSQDASQAYVERNDKVKNEVTVDVVKKYANKDAEKEAKYRGMIEQVFERFWNLPDFRADVSSDTLQQMQSTKTLLTEQYSAVKTHLDNLSLEENTLDQTVKAKKAEIAKIQQEKAAIAQAAADADNETLGRLKGQHQSLQDSITALQQLLSALNDEVSSLQKEASDLDAQISAQQKKKADLAARLQSAQETKTLLNDKQQDLEKIKNDINYMWRDVTSHPVVSLDAAAIKKVIDEFNTNQGMMQSLAPQMQADLAPKVKDLSAFISLAETMHQCKEQMCGRFNAAKNVALVQQLTDRMTCCKLQPAQTKECRTVVEALQQQAVAHQALVDFIDAIPQVLPCLTDDSDRQYLNENLDYRPFLEGGSSYNVLYEKQNGIVEQLRQDLKIGGSKPNKDLNDEDKMNSYLNKVKAEL